MTSLIEGANKQVARGTEIGNRVKGLDLAVNAARGRIDETQLAPAAEVVAKASERLRLSADHTVVALGGATGSGKSSTFNALVGLELASVSVRRPTTSWATACTWGSRGASELLEWLGIPPRHQILRDSMLDTGREAKGMDGLVLLDMPDHDSTEVSHHLEVERLVRLADLLIWVLDPQKYADAAIHDRFLRPLAAHKGVMLIVLNHIDEVAEERRAGMVADLRRLLDADGLEGITLIATSAREGIGIDDLRDAITQRVADKAATRARISTNIAEVARGLRQISGDAPPPTLKEQDQADLRAALADAAGVPVIVEAVERVSATRARSATSWPLTSWLGRFKRDQFRDLNLDVEGREFVARAKAALPQPGQVQGARVDGTVRDLADRLSTGLTRPWSAAIQRASVARLGEVSERLDTAMARSRIRVGRPPLWAQVVRVVQWALLLIAVAGGLWLAASSGADFLPDPQQPDVEVAGLGLPALMLIAGLALGALLGVVGRLLVDRGAKARAQQADHELRSAVNQVADELVIVPLVRELEAYRTATEGLRAALA